MKYILILITVVIALSLSVSCKKLSRVDPDPIHDTIFVDRTQVDTVRFYATKSDTIIRYNNDTTIRDIYHTDTIIVVKTQYDTLVQHKYDTVYLTKTTHDTINRFVFLSDTVNNYITIVKHDTVLQTQIVIQTDTIWGQFASMPSTGRQHIAIHQYSDTSTPGQLHSKIIKIVIGGVTYVPGPDTVWKNSAGEFIDVPNNQITNMQITISQDKYSWATIAIYKFYPSNYVMYMTGLQIGGPSDTQVFDFPYVDVNNTWIIEMSDFGLHKTSANTSKPGVKATYEQIKNVRN